MEIEKSIAVFKALSDASRLKLLQSLLQKPQYVEELAERIGLGVSTVSFHLKKLEQAGLVRKKKEQYYLIYSAEEDLFRLSLSEMISFNNTEIGLQERRLREYRQQVLKTYFKRGRLERIPIQHKKRLIVLEELAAEFSVGRIYKERDVDEILASFNGDYCSLRRYMIDAGIMQRNNGEYRITDSYAESQTGLRGTKRQTVKKGDDMDRQRELKKAYKQTIQPMGIMQIKNEANGKVFIVSSLNLNGVANKHRFQLRMGSHINRELQQDWDKYGAENFSFEIIDRLEPKEDTEYDYREDLKTLEDLWLEKLKPFIPCGYNRMTAAR